ncbi:hypothetical protein [Paraburkholderia sp. UYCP14C]|nr:hypothetical protein [Paraburkholderia sp. UYCP14C]
MSGLGFAWLPGAAKGHWAIAHKKIPASGYRMQGFFISATADAARFISPR